MTVWSRRSPRASPVYTWKFLSNTQRRRLGPCQAGTPHVSTTPSLFMATRGGSRPALTTAENNSSRPDAASSQHSSQHDSGNAGGECRGLFAGWGSGSLSAENRPPTGDCDEKPSALGECCADCHGLSVSSRLPEELDRYRHRSGQGRDQHGRANARLLHIVRRQARLRQGIRLQRPQQERRARPLRGLAALGRRAGEGPRLEDDASSRLPG